MFESTSTQDQAPARVTRRVFLAGAVGASASLAALWIFRTPGIEASVAVHGTPGEVSIAEFSNEGVSLGILKLPKIIKSDGAWYRQLGSNSFDIARRGDTEIPYSGSTWREHSRGLYRCIGCQTALFSSQTKFDSGTGWPSFWAALAKENIIEKSDTSLGVERTEAQCARCEAHLGHVFPDGPEPTGLRYCMNSASMRFIRTYKATR